MPRYNPAEIEPKWQRFWESHETFKTPSRPDGPKFYALDMFPYPSGDGLHVGHPEGYTATDIVCRYGRMRGKSVMHPMGFDAFGLPAEEHAIKTNTHPRVQTEHNIANFRRQLKMLGFSYDWSREIATTDVEYFRWTQWIFLQLFDTWFDEDAQRGRPIAELPIPAEVQAAGAEAVREYQDEHRLAFQSDAPVNWCPALGTVLANEEVIDGRSERGNHPVERRPLRQWMLRITAYADRLEKGLDQLDWPTGIKALQRNWIGRSTGAEVDFFLGGSDQFNAWIEDRTAHGFPRKPDERVLRIYTTRPDTLFGATYMVIAPEHPFVDQLTTADRGSQVNEYCQQAAAKSELERTELAKTKTGVFTGGYAINPVNQQPVPIWVADYVLASYGTGAIMAVPAHDERDFDFARQFQLPIVPVVDPGDATADRAAVLAGQACSVTTGVAINSAPFDGLPTDEFKSRITEHLNQQGVGRGAVQYKLRDWLFSRQRFWGEPFPILHELDANDQPTGALRAVAESELPVDLPHLEDFRPHGRPEPPLDKAPDEWLYVHMDGKKYKRETNTMPQWAGSCWYYLRFLDPHNSETLVAKEIEQQWMPVDLYVGGAEHAVLHLLYARFWHKVLFDRGAVSTPEPFQRLVNQGMILGEVEITGYQNGQSQWISATSTRRNDTGELIDAQTGEAVQPVKVAAADTDKVDDRFVLAQDPSIALDSRAYKMSKSRGNVINPDDIVREYGADTLRLYEMYMGPLEAPKPWNMDSVSGMFRFLSRVWRMIVDQQAEQLALSPSLQEVAANQEQLRVLHKTIAAVTKDTESMSFNTAIARMMEFANYFTKETVRPRSIMRQFVLLLAPYAPHLAEELWSLLGGQSSLAYEPWPVHDETLLIESTVEIPVQVNGKLRAKIQAPAEADRDALEKLAASDEKVRAHVSGRQIVKTIIVPGRLVNFVIK